MKNRRLVTLISVFVIGLFATPAFADDKTDKNADQEVDTEDPPPPPKTNNSSNTAASPCGFHANASYLVGQFSGEDSSDRFVRKGFDFGLNCRMRTGTRLTILFGSEFYVGKFSLNHQESSLKGSVSSPEAGFKGWVRPNFNFNRVKLAAMLGTERTKSSGFDVSHVEIAYGGGWFDLTDWARDHLSVTGQLVIYEAGLDASFMLPKHFAVTFGLLWQRYNVAVKVRVDDEGKEFLEAVDYDVDKVNRNFDNSADFIYLTPGVKWFRKNWGASLTIPWGIFKTDDWSWGLVVGGGMRFQ